MLDYRDRLANSMKQAGVKPQKLADGIGISYQGVKKVLDGKSGSFSAENNSKAAVFLKVDPDWLATGIEAHQDQKTTQLKQVVKDEIEEALALLHPVDAKVWRAELKSAENEVEKIKAKIEQAAKAAIEQQEKSQQPEPRANDHPHTQSGTSG